MPATFLLVLAFMMLWPLGAAIFITCLAGFFSKRWREKVRPASTWGLVGRIVVSTPVALITVGISEVLGHEFVQFVVQCFFVGFALGLLARYVFRYFFQVRQRAA